VLADQPPAEIKPTGVVCVALIMAHANDADQLAVIRPIEFVDEVTGDKISVSVSDRYSKISVNQREYYFKRENGEFDGTSTALVEKGPFAV
jgi:hypothetical protein